MWVKNYYISCFCNLHTSPKYSYFKLKTNGIFFFKTDTLHNESVKTCRNKGSFAKETIKTNLPKTDFTENCKKFILLIIR